MRKMRLTGAYGASRACRGRRMGCHVRAQGGRHAERGLVTNRRSGRTAPARHIQGMPMIGPKFREEPAGSGFMTRGPPLDSSESDSG